MIGVYFAQTCRPPPRLTSYSHYHLPDPRLARHISPYFYEEIYCYVGVHTLPVFTGVVLDTREHGPCSRAVNEHG